jgi:cytoskeleton protein RodZ
VATAQVEEEEVRVIAKVSEPISFSRPIGSKSDILLLKAREESWVSVIDADDKRLMYGVLTNGTPRKLQGMAPFKIVFGAAPGIEVRLNGSLVEFGSMIRKSKTARFIIDADGSSHK